MRRMTYPGASTWRTSTFALVSNQTDMLYELGVWFAALILLSPLIPFGLAWAKINHYDHNGGLQRRQRFFYLIALAAGSENTLAYLGYWSWRVCQLYHATLPLMVLLSLEQWIHVSRAASTAAVACLLISRGPYRVLMVLATLWMTFQLWQRGDIIHWA